MSTTTCYHCDGLGTVSDGLDLWGDAKDRPCRHCGGTGQEPEDLETEPVAGRCDKCEAANCPTRDDPSMVWCAGFKEGP